MCLLCHIVLLKHLLGLVWVGGLGHKVLSPESQVLVNITAYLLI